MADERLVIVGGVAAGTKAASRARRVDPDLEITIYQEEPDISISECGMPYAISGLVEERAHLVARTPDDFAENDVEVLVRHRVERLDPETKKLTVKNLETGEEFEDSYDRLVIATGAKSLLPPIDGADLRGVFNFRFLTDLDRIRDYIKEQSPRKAAVIGGGYIGLEVVENLVELGIDVSLIEADQRLARTYGPEVAERIEGYLKEKGVYVSVEDEVSVLNSDGEGRVRAVHCGEEEIPAEIVIVGTGIEPEVSLAEEAGAAIGASGAISVDRYLRTSLPDVWAAGDCVETIHLVTGGTTWMPLGDTANQMGRVAGTNAAKGSGESSLEFPGVLGTGVFKVFDIGVAKTGLSEREAEEAGFEAVAATVESKSKAGYFPGAEKTLVKLIADKATGRLLGAEVIGGNADKHVDVCATALWGRLSYPDLINLDLAYAPPFGPTLSPVISAASVLANEFERAAEGVRATE